MDIFNTVVSAIDLAQRVRKLIDDHCKAPERLRALQFEITSLQSILEKVKVTKSLETDSSLKSEIVEIEGILWRHMRNLSIQKGYGELDELTRELQKRKMSLNLSMVVYIGANVQPRAAPTSHITAREFLNFLDAPNYVDDLLHIKDPSKSKSFALGTQPHTVPQCSITSAPE
ncbi:hypothetical protein HFD88_010460 [Aspergillus terreus]|nr:hypothetical protein HFD88_010460 [Aspergillus terreus]